MKKTTEPKRKIDPNYPDRLHSNREVWDFLGIKRGTLNNRRIAGLIRYAKGTTKYTAEEVLRHQSDPTAQSPAPIAPAPTVIPPPVAGLDTATQLAVEAERRRRNAARIIDGERMLPNGFTVAEYELLNRDD